MFVFNLKFCSPKKTGCILAAGAVVVAVICVISMVSIHNGSVPDVATCDELGSYSLNAENAEEQCRFLNQFGLVADINSADKDNIIIPAHFNLTYEQYNNLQKKVGLDLSRYSGKEAQKITYTLKNSKTKYAVLVVYKGRVIGAHLTNGEYGQENLPLF